MTAVHLSTEVGDALHAGTGVVALESAVLTCGLPRHPWNDEHGPCPEGVDPTQPLHLATCRAMMQAVRDADAVPALCGVLDGQPSIGLTNDACAALSHATAKASPDSIALHAARGVDAGTTVGGTLRLIEAAANSAPPIRFFATGGIGGVHHGWQTQPDVSADLPMLGRVPCAVICAGAKSLLDAHATHEALQTLGVPVLGLDCDRLPGFVAAGSEDAPNIDRVSEDLDGWLDLHWSMGGGGALLVQNPPAAMALEADHAAALSREAELAVSIRGAGRTPGLLDWMAKASGGASLRANIALLLANAATAGRLASS